MSLAILQNFIVSKQERLDALAETLPAIAKHFTKYNFYINFNSDTNFDKVYTLYKDNIKNLSFYNNLTTDYGLIVQSMLSEISENYVFIIPEDFKLVNNSNYFSELLDEFIHYDCDFMLMHRIEEVKCYGINPDYLHLYDTKNNLHLVDSSKYPGSCISSVAIYKKSFLNEVLEKYNNSQKSTRFPLATPNCYEWFSHENIYSLVGSRKFAIPKKAVVQHYEPFNIKERI
jgi:hypothetical protein